MMMTVECNFHFVEAAELLIPLLDWVHRKVKLTL